MKKLFIDFGHSNRFQGAMGVANEVRFVRRVGDAVKTLIDQKKWEAVMVPDSFLTDYSSNRNLVNRINWINKRATPQDWLVSIHSNAASNRTAHGITTVYMDGYSCMERYALRMTEAVSKATGVHSWNGGVFPDTSNRWGRVGMVRDTEPMALLIECGFCTNAEDMAVPSVRYADGIADFFNNLNQ
jgi:N-acetylmuramoyl-L-alanine amidase